jgi:UDP-N-acetylmuramate: L-alanyl-gamma-D-glutamyl-meso-diaminopimelate ligase
LHYRPQSAILTSVEFDHADIYRDLDHVKNVFRRFVHILPTHGFLAAGLDFPQVGTLLQAPPCAWEGYGFATAAHWRAVDIETDAATTRFVVQHRGQTLGSVCWSLPGRHNIQNALGVIAVASRVGVSFEDVQAGLHTFTGVARRQEVRGTVGGVTVIDDFAHHPTAVRETLAALRARSPGRPQWAIFEPRSATSRRAIFQEEYVEALAAADHVVIAGLYNPDHILAAERLSPERLAHDIAAKHGQDAHYIPDVEAIVAHIVAHVQAGDVVVMMSNGGFGRIHDKLLCALPSVVPSRP